MNQLLLLAGVVIVACILMNRIAAKLPLPSLLLFIGLGTVSYTHLGRRNIENERDRICDQ